MEPEWDGAIAIAVKNEHRVAIKFYLEPWGDEHEFPAGATFNIVFFYPRVPVRVFCRSDAVIVEGDGGYPELWFGDKRLN